MVQRKLANKLSIPKTENLNSENRPGKLRPPSPRFQDIKNKATEMKKKMKRSKSMDRSTIESCLKTPSFIKQSPQPGKPPTDEKQKQIPNYMKSTSSFEARKEQSQVNSKSPKKHLENSIILTRKTSLKKVRSLTKTPSFKPTRVANKKCQKVDSKSQKATCSSTLKDCKFPNYLELSHGATESEGTSLMKVCPYTYCSLNGHRHAPLPPLKSFLSAKRRVLKTQKNTQNLGMNPSCNLEREVSREMVSDEKATIQQPMVQEEQMDFYIEIYVENREDDPITQKDAELAPQDEEIRDEAMEINSIKSNQEEETIDSDSYDMEWEEGQHPAEEKEGYDSDNTSSFENEKIYEDYESTINNTQVLEIDVTHEEVFVSDFLAEDSIDSEEIVNSDNETQKQPKSAYTRGRGCSGEDPEINKINLQITKCNKSDNDADKEREFNPREPNYLPVTPDPEGEKVDLRHQDLDDRKNSEEFMIDYALQQTVTKLGPARKKKVALLVEAFEKVIPPPHYEPRLKHTNSAFAPIRPIQACS